MTKVWLRPLWVVVGAMLLLAIVQLGRAGGVPQNAFLAAVHVLPAQGPTVIQVSGEVLHRDVKRLGMNLGGESYYDSRQMLRNLVSRNPGFEGEQWQVILDCAQATSTSCTDSTRYSAWPADFLAGATYEVITGVAKGQTGQIVHSSTASTASGITVEFGAGAVSPRAGDVVVVRKQMGTSDPAEGWWSNLTGGAALASETRDLSPKTPGLRALRIRAAGPGQSASIHAYFDSTPGHSFVQLNGPYVVRFRAKRVSGSQPILLDVRRIAAGVKPLFQREVPLTESWQDYSFSFDAAEKPDAVGTAVLEFAVTESEVLLDDVSLEPAGSNGTAFRDEVVASLERLHPGILRDMDSGPSFGSSLDNLLAVQDAREMTGYNTTTTNAEDVPIGIQDFLILAEKIEAEPWYTTPLGMSEQEARDLMEYLGGSTNTKYGAKRAAMGHPIPWTQTFPVIHIEFGNEAWNDAQKGATIPNPATYAERASTILRAMRSSPWYSPSRFDLIVNSQAVNPYLSQQIIRQGTGFDTIDIAPYLFSTFLDDASLERVFGPMFAQPEMMDSSPDGVIRQQADIAAHAGRPVKLAVYETGISTTEGTVQQASLDKTVPSIAAGLTAVDHMLLMLRDLGITAQNTFELASFQYGFRNTLSPSSREESPIWGVVIDMDGATNRVRPSFLAQELANEVILPTMLTTKISGDNPTWNQSLSANDKVVLKGAHELQSFAFTDGRTDSLIVFNLSRNAARNIRVAGPDAPHGTVKVQTLTSAQITDSNESKDEVKVSEQIEHAVRGDETEFQLPPFSMTVFACAHDASVPTPH